MGFVRMSRNKHKRMSVQTSGDLTLLPAAGPFAGLTAPLASSLTNFSGSSGSTHLGVQNRASPFKRNLFTITGTKIIIPNQGSAFLWANVVTIGAGTVMHADGEDGGSSSPGNAGNGGSGGTGGGGGAGSDSGRDLAGGTAVTGTNGNMGEDGDLNLAGFGGTGYALTRWALDGYTYPTGGNGDVVGGNGYGGGAYGLGFQASIHSDPMPGGPAGAGIVVIVCNSLLGSGTLRSRGGAPGSDPATDFTNEGGGGAILVCTRSYTGQLTVDVTAGGGGGFGGTDGSAKIYKINSDLSLTAKLWTDVF
jgi:hypothetical protein